MNNEFETSTSFKNESQETIWLPSKDHAERIACFKILKSVTDNNASKVLRAFMYYVDELQRRNVVDYLFKSGMKPIDYNKALSILSGYGIDVYMERNKPCIRVDKLIYENNLKLLSRLDWNHKLMVISISHQYVLQRVLPQIGRPKLRQLIIQILNNGNYLKARTAQEIPDHIGMALSEFKTLYNELRYMGIHVETYHDADEAYDTDDFQYLEIDREVFDLWKKDHNGYNETSILH